ncbi:MAG: hypothetical protein V4635_10425 [Bacteroidota bacterium]
MSHPFFRTYLISWIFIVTFSFPFLNDRLEFLKDSENLENRKLAVKPAFNIKSLDAFPPAFEKYYNDTFTVRARIMTGFNIYNCVFLLKSPIPEQIIAGKHGWLYLGKNDMDCYLGKNGLSETELASFKNELEKREKYLASKKCKFYVMITPAKANIYPEHLPDNLYKQNQAWGEQVLAYMRANSNVRMIDLYGVFRSLKPQGLLYYMLENHWNHLGAFHAANTAINVMSADFPDLKKLDLSDYKITVSPRDIGNMKQMLGNLDLYMDVDYQVLPTNGFKATVAASRRYPVPAGCPYSWEYEHENEIRDSGAPKLLIFSDSFGGHIFPYLSEHFSRSVKIFDGWDYLLNKDIVEKEKPDIVLLMVQEPIIREIFKPGKN